MHCSHLLFSLTSDNLIFEEKSLLIRLIMYLYLEIEHSFFKKKTVDKVHFMDAVYSLFFYNRFMKTNARSDGYDV